MLRNKRRGQVSVLFALLMPIFLLFAGLALDLGWYYLNVSRLQNAADAAAIAGAQSLITDVDALSGYKSVALVNNYKEFIGSSYKYLPEERSTQRKIDTVNADSLKEYVNKNLSSSSKDSYVDAWTNTKIDASSALYEVNDKLYYVVHLSEKIRHFFLPSWFNDMNAPVTAVALLSKTNESITPAKPEEVATFITPEMPVLTFNESTLDPVFADKLDQLINGNTLVGNWEVQNKYRNDNGTFTYTDEEGNKVTISQYEARFGTEVYSEAWNHFQDFYNHYTAGDFFRKETVTIKDDLVGEVIKEGYKFPTKWGEQSSVAATSASINTYKNDSAYNPGVNARKTYKEGITDTSIVGRPYIWQRLDSINIDFKPEVTLSGDWLKKDWDIGLDDTGVTFNYRTWDTSGGYGFEDIKKLRIHSNINYEDPYKSRPNAEEDPDILWTRIESEPMLYHPDITNLAKKLGITSSIINQTGLTSVRQIFVNFNKSNYDRGDEKYRPVIVFYDGPETNSIYDDYTGWVRQSQPLIVNMNVPYRAIIYAPNSPVVIMGSHQNDFEGFVVAKSYHRLKTTADFEYSHRRYYEKGNRSNTVNSGPYYEDVYKVKGSEKPGSKENYYYRVVNEDGIEMFVDYWGSVQTEEIPPPKKRGKYNNFNRSDFSTHNFTVLSTAADNLLLSGR